MKLEHSLTGSHIRHTPTFSLCIVHCTLDDFSSCEPLQLWLSLDFKVELEMNHLQQLLRGSSDSPVITTEAGKRQADLSAVSKPLNRRLIGSEFPPNKTLIRRWRVSGSGSHWLLPRWNWRWLLKSWKSRFLWVWKIQTEWEVEMTYHRCVNNSSSAYH